MTITVAAIIIFFALTAKGKLIPGRLQSLGEMSYEFIANMVKDTFTIGMVVLAGIWKNGLKWFKIFAPAGLPFPMYFLIVPIEIISFLSRPVTLAVRLFANMTAGHVMMKLFAIFIAFLIGQGGLMAGAAIVPILGTVAIVALEFLVSGLQAFVFAILTCVYLNDVYHVDH